MQDLFNGAVVLKMTLFYGMPILALGVLFYSMGKSYFLSAIISSIGLVFGAVGCLHELGMGILWPTWKALLPATLILGGILAEDLLHNQISVGPKHKGGRWSTRIKVNQ